MSIVIELVSKPVITVTCKPLQRDTVLDFSYPWGVHLSVLLFARSQVQTLVNETGFKRIYDNQFPEIYCYAIPGVTGNFHQLYHSGHRRTTLEN